MKFRITLLGASALLLAACGGSGAEAGGENGDDGVAGNIQIQTDAIAIEDVATSTTTTVAVGQAGGTAEGEDGDGEDGEVAEDPTTEDTIPQNEDEAGDPDDLFAAMRIFNECLEDNGVEFVGAPNADAEPDDPVNDPDYLSALGECAALSNIQEAFTSFSEATENLNPEEIEERNRGLVIWADCMQGRGWTIGELVPDDRGLLSPGTPEPPDGQNLLGSDDLQECATSAQDETESTSG